MQNTVVLYFSFTRIRIVNSASPIPIAYPGSCDFTEPNLFCSIDSCSLCTNMQIFNYSNDKLIALRKILKIQFILLIMILLILSILFNSCIWRETATGVAIATFLFCLIYIIYRGTIYILDNLNAVEFCDAIQGTYSQQSASERASIEKVLAQKENIKSSFIRTLRQHLVNFSEGIAASIVANQLQK